MPNRIPTVALLTVSMLALITASVGNAATASRAAHTKCPPSNRHPHQRVSDRQAVVYEGLILHGEAAGQEEVFGCAFRQGRSYAIGERPGEGSQGAAGVEKFTLTGPMLAYESFDEAIPGARWEVQVRDLSNGRLLRAVPTGPPLAPNEPSNGVGPLVTLLVKRDGSAAWIAKDYARTGAGSAYYDVEAVDHSGSRLLASGTNIKPHSLKLVGSALQWEQGGKLMSTTLR